MEYLRRVAQIPGLSAEQEVELARRIETGLAAEERLAEGGASLSADARIDLEWIAEVGARAKNHLLEANLRLVVSLAKRYTGRGMPFLDLIQEGNLGLIRAADKFDYTKGYRFSTYATWWIRQAITRALAGQPPALRRIPVEMVEVINKLARTRRQMRRELGREPTPDELAVELDVTPEQVIEVQQYVREPEPPTAPGEDQPGRAGGRLTAAARLAASAWPRQLLLGQELHGRADREYRLSEVGGVHRGRDDLAEAVVVEPGAQGPAVRAVFPPGHTRPYRRGNPGRRRGHRGIAERRW